MEGFSYLCGVADDGVCIQGKSKGQTMRSFVLHATTLGLFYLIES